MVIYNQYLFELAVAMVTLLGPGVVTYDGVVTVAVAQLVTFAKSEPHKIYIISNSIATRNFGG